MTTVNHYQGIDEIYQTLDAVRSRRWMLKMLTAVCAVVAVTVAALLVGALVTGYWPDQPPMWLRWVLLIGACAACAASAVWFLLRAAIWRQNLAQTARFVEQGLPDLRNDMINSVLLSRETGVSSPELVQQAIHEAVRRARRADAQKTVSPRPLQRWGIAAGAACAVLAGFAALAPDRLSRGLMAMRPGAYVPAVNQLELVSLTPGDTKVFAGTPVEIAAEIRNDQADALDGRVLIDGAEPIPMVPSPDYTRFVCPLGPLDQTLQYAVQIGSARWPADRPYYRITVVKRVQVAALRLVYKFPPYMKLPDRVAPNASDGAIEAPVGTTVELTVRLSDGVPAARIQMAGQTPRPMAATSGGSSFSTTIPVSANGGYRLTFEDGAGKTLQQLPDLAQSQAAGDSRTDTGRMRMNGLYPITAVPDAPPKVEFISPARDVAVAPGGKLQTKLRIYDLYGLTAAAFYAGKENTQPQLVHTYKLAEGNEAILDYTFPLAGFTQGDVVVYFATATDNRSLPRLGLEGQTASSAKHKILVQDANTVAVERAKRHEEIRRRLLAILKMQESQRVNTEICHKKHTELKQVATAGGRIVAGQTDIKAAMLDLVENVPFDPEMVTVQQAVALLAQNEGQLAIDQAMVLAKLDSMDSRGNACTTLAATQDRIISVLQDLLAIMPSLGSQSPAAKTYKPGDDLPPEVQEKLKELEDGLKKFVEEQRKAIDASRGLAKKPVDSFTPADEKLLKDLKAIQDKWEKFLEEKITDFSKLAQQDFSNPQLLKELISVKSDVTMAADALSKKATEIATAIEDNGIENAESLTANLEKWLPDEPDRIKWKMENPTDDMDLNTEQPNLPTELEDLVGDLLEEEEDLFEEMQDQTGKYNMSGDKGIGWDAMDGPISNMNAQGVTGNQLPNPSEISGRSGEGRQGKSTGEFVEDKFVGKGGRRTPTRLTPEPFQRGEINDQSTEPPGGSTGGGKLSGAGGEGLEGPVPPPLAREMQRLAGKQADLISRGRRFLENYQQKDFASFKLLQSITLLDRVRGDLENYRYQNVLRARKVVLDSLQQTKLAVDRRYEVTVDRSGAMPKYIQDSVADAMKGKMPEEFRDVLEQYYKRLSEQGGK